MVATISAIRRTTPALHAQLDAAAAELRSL